MNGSEEKLRNNDLIKQRIRDRYKGVDEDVLDSSFYTGPGSGMYFRSIWLEISKLL